MPGAPGARPRSSGQPPTWRRRRSSCRPDFRSVPWADRVGQGRAGTRGRRLPEACGREPGAWPQRVGAGLPAQGGASRDAPLGAGPGDLGESRLGWALRGVATKLGAAPRDLTGRGLGGARRAGRGRRGVASLLGAWPVLPRWGSRVVTWPRGQGRPPPGRSRQSAMALWVRTPVPVLGRWVLGSERAWARGPRLVQVSAAGRGGAGRVGQGQLRAWTGPLSRLGAGARSPDPAWGRRGPGNCTRRPPSRALGLGACLCPLIPRPLSLAAGRPPLGDLQEGLPGMQP